MHVLFWLVAARVSGLFVGAPVFSQDALPRRYAILLVLALAAALAPVSVPDGLPDGATALLAGMVGEFAIGWCIGLLARLLLATFQLAGTIAGNEIVVPSVVCVKLPRSAKRVLVALSYHEVEEQPIATFEPGMQMGVIRESFEIALIEENPALKHGRLRPGTPGCGKAHPICLAAVHRRKTGWKIARLKARAPAKRRRD